MQNAISEPPNRADCKGRVFEDEHCSLLTAHCSPLTAHRSPLTAHRSPPTAYCSLLTAHCLLLTAHCSLLTAHCSPLTAHRSPCHSRLLGFLTSRLPRCLDGNAHSLPGLLFGDQRRYDDRRFGRSGNYPFNL